MLSAKKLEDGLAYAEDNFSNDNAPHLKVDKRIVRELLDLTGKRVLDFGCGMGGMTLWYASNWDCEVQGIDIDEHHLQVAGELQARANIKNVQFWQRNILTDPLKPEEKIDLVFMNDVVEHIELSVLMKLFQQLGESVTHDGAIFVSFSPWTSPHASHVAHAVGLPWAQFLPQSYLEKLIRKNNREIIGDLEPDLLTAYRSLNRLDHSQFVQVLKNSAWGISYRKSYSFFNRIPGAWNLNLRLFPFTYLVTKEFYLLKKK